MKADGAAPGIFNAANEVAVDAFTRKRIKFIEIAKIVEKTLETIDNREPVAIDEVLEYDSQARVIASQLVDQTP
jgi:1-deoxy-D-xylulose-5-phosphate reductoisomerase